MKKVLSLVAILCMALVLLAGCNLQPTETPCEHTWADATCTAPKTCSLCGATDGEALGHNAIEVFGQAPTCTEPGQTNFVYCDVCDKNLSEAQEIAPLGHTEETIAGTPATCTEPGLTDGKKCTVCGVTTVEQTVIDAFGHKPEADDGDITTPVKCANEGCGEILVAAKEAITLTIPEFANGAVVADKKNYAIGDTVKLTINPEWGYAQKLYVDGEPLMLDWNNNVYTFVAEKDTYVISGSFELVLDMAAGDVTRWDYSNQGHGIVTTYYPNNNDAWWFQINGDYKSFSINAKNYREVANSYENGPDGGWRIALYMKLDNGNYYAFSMWIDTNKIYAYQHFGGKIAGDKDSTTGWSGAWRNLAEWNAEATAALNGDGAEFKLDRIDGNHIQISFGGVVLETYEIPGVTAENKVVAVGLHHWGNKGSYVDIPFELTSSCQHTWVDATCTAPKTCSTCKVTIGEKIDHTYTNYVSDGNATCTADGTKTGTCVCGEKDTIADVGSKVAHTEETVPGKSATCTENGLTDGKKCSVCGVTTVEQTVIPANDHKDDNGDYKCDVCGANLCTDHVEETVAGKAATCTEDGLTDGKKCSICGSVMLPQEVIPAKGHTANADDGNCATAVVCANGCGYIFVEAMNHDPEADDGDVTTAVKCANAGCEQILVPAKEAIALTIPTLENGTITADKKNYAVGDTVTLTVAPAKDYAQKLYINGKPLLVDTNSKYSFVVEEGKTYDITGEFVYVKGAWYWTAEYSVLNQAHGVFHSPVPASGEKNGELVPAADKYCGGKVLVKDPSGGTKKDFAIVLKMTFSDGQKAEVRLVNKDGNGHYMVQSMSGMFGSWKWYYDLNDEENAAVASGEGVWFGLVRYGTDIELSLNGKVLPHRADTPISLAENTVLNQFKVTTYNFSYAIDVQYEFYMNGSAPVKPEPPVEEEDDLLTIGSFANGTVTADKDSYEVGDTVTLTVAPNKNFAQKLYINGEPLLVDTNSKYSFVIEEGKTYDITGEFVSTQGKWYWTAEYIVLNQAHGVFHSPVPTGGEKNGELVPTADKCYGGKVLVKDPSGGTKQDFAIVLKMQFSDGQKAELRLVNKDGKGHYMVQSMSGMFGSWKWYYDLNDEENAAVASGEGVWFELVRDGSNINIIINGKVIPHRADTPISLAESTVLNQFKVTTYNYSYAIDVKYEFYMYE